MSIEPPTQNEPTQDEPVLEQNAATEQERLDGLSAQLRADLAGEDAETIEQAVRHRLADSGIPADEAFIALLISEIAG